MQKSQIDIQQSAPNLNYAKSGLKQVELLGFGCKSTF